MDLEYLAFLENMLTENRKERFEQVLAHRSNHFTVVIEDVFQLHNTSAVMRSCEVFGIQQLNVIEERYTKSIDKEIAMGAQKWVDVNRYNSITNCISDLKNKGYQIIATTPHHDDCELDDFDIISALKSWQNNDDFILSSLSKMIINRDLLKIKFNSEKFSKEEMTQYIDLFSQANGISNQDAAYFVFKGKIKNQAYSIEAEPIRILKKDKTIEDVMLASDQLNLKALSKPVTKYYICFPKQLAE